MVVGQDHGAWQRYGGASRVRRMVAGTNGSARPGLNGANGSTRPLPPEPEHEHEHPHRTPRARRVTDGYIGWGYFGIAWALWILAIRNALRADSWAALLYAAPALLVTVCAVGILFEMWRTRGARAERARRAEAEAREALRDQH